jgi:hypothetical protein
MYYVKIKRVKSFLISYHVASERNPADIIELCFNSIDQLVYHLNYG